MKELIRLIKNADRVYICGNGGSSATAEHFASDLFSKGIKAFSLNSNTAIMTMIANDYGYEDVFSKQIELYGTNNDLLITISCSGTSPNIVEAINEAKIKGMDVYKFKKFVADSKDYEGLEDKHMQLVHRVKKEL
jgi:D-sedoheptulose 7-phosphate isomerase